jgi:hypothetical protein
LSFPTETALNAKNCITGLAPLPRPIAPFTHARHDGIWQQSLEWDAHGCGSVCSVAVVVRGVGYRELVGGSGLGWSEVRCRTVQYLGRYRTDAHAAWNSDSTQRVPFRTTRVHRLRQSGTRYNYSTCRAISHFHTNSIYRHPHAPSRHNNCARTYRAPPPSPQRRATRQQKPDALIRRCEPSVHYPRTRLGKYRRAEGHQASQSRATTTPDAPTIRCMRVPARPMR